MGLIDESTPANYIPIAETQSAYDEYFRSDDKLPDIDFQRMQMIILENLAEIPGENDLPLWARELYNFAVEEVGDQKFYIRLEKEVALISGFIGLLTIIFPEYSGLTSTFFLISAASGIDGYRRFKLKVPSPLEYLNCPENIKTIERTFSKMRKKFHMNWEQ